MKDITKKSVGLIVGLCLGVLLFGSVLSVHGVSAISTPRGLRSEQTTVYLTGAVAGREVDYFQIDDVEPGLMSVSVSWGNSYDIDCYISTSPTYLSYLARGYTTSNPETCSYNIQSAGTYYIAIRMYSRSAPSTSYTVTLTYYTTSGNPDTENPTVSITSPSNGQTVSDTISISASASDNVGVDYVQCQVDGGSWSQDSTSPYSWTLDTTALSDGNHQINVVAYDAAGNSDSDSITINVLNDQGGEPQLITEELTGSVAGYEVDYFELNGVEPGLMSVSVSWSGSYDIDCYICTTASYSSYLARGYTTNNPETCSYTIQTAGTYYIAVRMYTSTAPSTAYVATVSYYTNADGDYTNPVVSITSPANGATVEGSVIVSASASDNEGVSYTQMQIDGGSWTQDSSAPYSWSIDTTALSEGSHTITVRAYDASGNYGTDSISITVDNVQGGGGKYALIVGISDYEAISDLSYCDEDATDWFNYLISIGYESQNIIVLGDGHTSNYPKYDGIASEYNIKYYLNWLADQEGEIVYTTSGHGDGDGNWNSYICAWDCASGDNGEDGNLYDYEIAAILETAVADDIFVFVDHCYSGGIGDDLMAMSNAYNVYCTTTCTEDGYGYDDSSHSNGAWTYYFVQYALINHFGSSITTSMENAFDYAAAAYPYSGGDAPMEFDGNTGSPFYL